MHGSRHAPRSGLVLPGLAYKSYIVFQCLAPMLCEVQPYEAAFSRCVRYDLVAGFVLPAGPVLPGLVEYCLVDLSGRVPYCLDVLSQFEGSGLAYKP